MLEIIETLDGPLENMIKIAQHARHDPFIGNMETIFKETVAVVKDILQKAKLSQMIR